MVLSGNSWCTGHSAHVIRVPQNSRRFFTKIIRQFNQLSVNLSIVYEIPLTALTRIPLRGSLSICRAWTMDSAVNPILDTRYAAKTTKFSERCPQTFMTVKMLVKNLFKDPLGNSFDLGTKVFLAQISSRNYSYCNHTCSVSLCTSTARTDAHRLVVWAWLCLSHASYYSNIRL